MSIISVKAKVKKELHYDKDAMYGVYAFIRLDSSEKLKEDADYGTFVVNGQSPKLKEKSTYEFTIEPSYSKRYKDGYSFVEFKQPKLDSSEGQYKLLEQIVTPIQYTILSTAYPDSMIIDLIKEDKIDVSKLKGIKEKSLKTIKDNVIEYSLIGSALVELKDLKLTPKAVNRLLEHFGNQSLLIEAVKENIYSLTDVSGFGFKRIDEFAMNRGDSPTNPNRIVSCFAFIMSEESNNGHTWIGLDSVLQQSRTLLNIDTDYIHEQITIINEGNSKRFKIIVDRFTTKQFHKMEIEIKQHLDRLMRTFKSFEDTIPLSEIEDNIGFTHTDEQRNVIEMTNTNGVVIINGLAGSGKTATVKSVVGIKPHNSYMTIALSGKAVNVLKSKGLESMTLHRMIYSECVHEFDTVIIDESSMVNLQLFHSILSSMVDGQQLILVGDNGQLPPIGVGSVFDDLLYSGTYARQELTQIHRQAQESGVITASHEVRHGKQITKYNQYDSVSFGVNKDMVLIPLSADDIHKNVLKIVTSYYKKHGDLFFDNFQILTPVKIKGQNSVIKLNESIQSIVNDMKGESIEKGTVKFYEGDRIIHNGNTAYKTTNVNSDEEMVYNGTTGRIIKIDIEEEVLHIQYEGYPQLIVHPFNKLDNIDLSYAITIHRSQGMGIKDVVMIVDFSAYNMLSKQLIYTGFTRTIDKLVVLCDNRALHKAVSTDLGSTRRTFLKDILKGD